MFFPVLERILELVLRDGAKLPYQFFLSPLPSKIDDLLVRILTSGTRKSPQRPNLESSVAGEQQSSHAFPKIHR